MSQSTMTTLICIIGILLAAVAAPVLAVPHVNDAGGLEARNVNCNDKLVVEIFSKYSSLASSFCSSYVPRRTATTVVVSTKPVAQDRVLDKSLESLYTQRTLTTIHLPRSPRAHPHRQRKSQ